MTNHTPAPWVIDEDGDVSSFDTKNQECQHVVIGQNDDEGVYFRSDADRHLILAAPDMYEALVAAKALIEFEGFEETGNYEQVCDALKKARGEV